MEGFSIVLTGGALRDVRATHIQVSGISVQFHAAFAPGAECRVDAVPARGYAGRCVFTSGDTAALTIIPPVAGMLLPDHEIALAKDAAPPHLRPGVSVVVLAAGGYFEAVRGTNGFSCFIERPTPEDLWPICHARDAAEAILPVEELRATLRRSGADEKSIVDSIDRGYQRGRFRVPPRGALGYMLSPNAWSVVQATGAREFIEPHLHFYMPYATDRTVGIDSTRAAVVLIRLEREGKADASLVVPVRLRG